MDWKRGGGLDGGVGAVSRQTQAAGCSRQAAYDHAEKVETAVRDAAGGGPSREQLQHIQPPTDREAEERQLTAARKRLVLRQSCFDVWHHRFIHQTMLDRALGQLRTRTINKIKHLLRKHNLEQEQPAKGLDTKRTRKWLATLPLGAIDRLEMDLQLEQWNVWDGQIAKLELEIEKCQAKSATAAVVATIPGCAAYGSLALASRIGSIKRFPRPASLANYWCPFSPEFLAIE